MPAGGHSNASLKDKNRRNQVQTGNHCEDPDSEVMDYPNKAKTYQREKDELDGFAKKSARGVNPTEIKRGSKDPCDSDQC